MKQILQSLKTGVTEVVEVPCPAVGRGQILIRSTRTLVSAGTERMLVEFGKAGWIEKARQQPDKVRMVLDKIGTDRLMPTLEAVFNKLDRPLPLGYCNVGVVMDVGENVAGFLKGERVVSNGRHAEVVSVPMNLCARVPEGVPVFHAVRAPTGGELQALLSRIIRRLMKLLTRKGYLIEEQGMAYLADTDPDLALGSLQAAACTYRIALGPRAGQKVLSLQTVPTQKPPLTPVRCVNEHGFSLHAEVCCAAHQRKKLEHLCRYITRPAIANKRLKRNSAGDVVLQLKSPYNDGTTHIVMSPLEFMQRLAALVPRPRLHLIRFHGVLAPNAKHRSAIVPSAPVTAFAR